MSEKIWSDDAWDDYLYWQTQDKKTIKRINLLIKDIERNGPLDGIGEPEALKGSLQGEFSRRINEKDRLVYHIEGDRIYIAACRGHYDDNNRLGLLPVTACQGLFCICSKKGLLKLQALIKHILYYRILFSF